MTNKTKTMTPAQFAQWLNHAQAIEIDGESAIAWPNASGIHFVITDEDGLQRTMEIEYKQSDIHMADDGSGVLAYGYEFTCYHLTNLTPMDYVK